MGFHSLSSIMVCCIRTRSGPLRRNVQRANHTGSSDYELCFHRPFFCLPLGNPPACTVFLQSNLATCVLIGVVSTSGVPPGAFPILLCLSRMFSLLPWSWHLIMVLRLTFYNCILLALTRCPDWVSSIWGGALPE